jgi:SPP1 family predicted phage head-tail adaptor
MARGARRGDGPALSEVKLAEARVGARPRCVAAACAQLVEIQQLGAGSPRQSSSGERLDAWTAFANVRAFIRPISGKELRAATRRRSAIDTEIEIRWLDGVKGAGAMRVVHRGVAYTIHAAIDPELRRKKLLLQCSSGVVNA